MSSLHEIKTAAERLIAIGFQRGFSNVAVVSQPSNVAQYFLNIDALKAFDTTGLANGTPAEVMGYYSAHDARLPGFAWDPTETATEDNALLYRPNNIDPGDPGRWKLRYNGAVRASHVGMRGGEAFAPIDSQIFNLITATCSELILDVDLYTDIRLQVGDCKVTGETKPDGSLYQIRPIPGFNNRAMLEFVDGAKSCGIEGIDLDTLGYISSLASRGVDPIWIRDNVEEVTISESRIASTGTTFSAPAWGIRIQSDGVRNFTVKDTQFIQLGDGVYFRGDIDGVLVERCDITQFIDHGLFFVPDVGSPQNVRILNNKIYENQQVSEGIRYPIEFGAVGTNQTKNVLIQGNTLYGWEGESHNQGVGFGSADQISLHHVKHGKIVNNTSYFGGGMGMTISINTDNILVEGNQCFNNNGGGIFCGNGAVDTKITGNTCLDNAQRWSNNVETPENGSAGIVIRQAAGASNNTRYVYCAGNMSGNTDGSDIQYYGIACQESQIFGVEIGENNYRNNRFADVRMY